MAATVPEWCLGGSRGECRLRVDHYRERKTGPCFALAVAACRKHPGRFTLYPPGHVPYGRVAIAPVSASGEVIVASGDEGGVATVWQGTVMGAALDAASGRAWQRNSSWEEPKRWRTQLRRLKLGARLVGIAVGIGKRERERVAVLLGVALVVMHVYWFSVKWTVERLIKRHIGVCVSGLRQSILCVFLGMGESITAMGRRMRWASDRATRHPDPSM